MPSVLYFPVGLPINTANSGRQAPVAAQVLLNNFKTKTEDLVSKTEFAIDWGLLSQLQNLKHVEQQFEFLWQINVACRF